MFEFRRRRDQHETSLDRRGGDRCACVLRTGWGATYKSIWGKCDGDAGSQPWRPGIDAVYHRPRSPSCGSCADGGPSCGHDAATRDVGYHVCDAAKAPSCARQLKEGASCRPFPQSAGQQRCQRVEPSRVGSAAIRQFYGASRTSGSRHGLAADLSGRPTRVGSWPDASRGQDNV
jgi:hypothetical protein